MALKSNFVLIGALCMATVPFASQADPTYNGVFVARLGKSPGDVPLERTEVHSIVKLGLMGLNGVSSTVQVSGDHSSVRFPHGATVSLIVKTADSQEDPQTLFKIVSMNVVKGTRQLRRNYTGWGQRQHDATDVSFDAQPYKAGMFRLDLAPTIAAGEYCAMGQPHQSGFEAETIGDHDLMPAYCFGID